MQVCGVPDDEIRRRSLRLDSAKAGRERTSEEIREFCQNQIAHYKIPRYIRFVTEFPMTITGKVQKFAMREHMIKEFGLTRGQNRLARRICAPAQCGF